MSERKWAQFERDKHLWNYIAEDESSGRCGSYVFENTITRSYECFVAFGRFATKDTLLAAQNEVEQCMLRRKKLRETPTPAPEKTTLADATDEEIEEERTRRAKAKAEAATAQAHDAACTASILLREQWDKSGLPADNDEGLLWLLKVIRKASAGKSVWTVEYEEGTHTLTVT